MVKGNESKSFVKNERSYIQENMGDPEVWVLGVSDIARTG